MNEFIVKKEALQNIINNIVKIDKKDTTIKIELFENKITINNFSYMCNVYCELQAKTNIININNLVIYINVKELKNLLDTIQDKNIDISFIISHELQLFINDKVYGSVLYVNEEANEIDYNHNIQQYRNNLFIVFQSDTLKKALHKLKDFTEKTNSDSCRKNLEGVNFDLYPNSRQINLVASNGHNMGVIELQNEMLENKPLPDDVGILNNESVVFLSNMLSNDNTWVKIHRNHERIIVDGYDEFSSRFWLFANPTCGAKYPDYKRAMPILTENQVTFNKKELNAVLKSLKPILVPKLKYITFNFTNNKCSLGVDSVEKILNFSGNCEDLKISFNYDYLIKIIKCIDGDDININFPDAKTSKQILITSNITKKEKYILMPMRT
jgi:DNA polymerase III sliding clamp (beta) subunit (PCNA family)